MVAQFPKRGEIYWVEFTPARGAEQAGRRPALIVQNDVGNRYAPTTIVAAITSKGVEVEYPTDVKLPEGTLPKPSKVLCSQLLTIAKERLGARLAQLDPPVMARVDQALKNSLALK
jgi:mRNA interferase MazF